jgi:hypothetical protein
MKTKLIIFSLLILYSTLVNSIFAQNWSCATIEPSTDFLQDIGVTEYVSSYPSRNINIYIHIIRTSAGTGGLTTAQVDNAIAVMSDDYSSMNICFTEIGRSYINNNTYYNFTSGLFSSLVAQNPHTNAIDIYLLPAVGYGGRADGIPGSALVLDGGYAGTKVLSHEMGHCLGLYHTHSGLGCGDYANCAEAINGSNCASCGDRVCDTPADPCLSGLVNASCAYTGGSGYTPLTNNIQSYTTPGCMMNFTAGQSSRIHTMISNSPILQSVLSSTSCCPTNITITTPLSSNTKQECSNGITASSSANVSSGYIWYDAGRFVLLNPGFVTNLSSNLSGHFSAFIEGCGGAHKTAELVEPIIAQSSSLNTSPNPFTQSTTIKYSLRKETNQVSLTIYDLTGREVQRLVDDEAQGEGSYSYELDGNNLSAGIYICVLKTDNLTQTYKAVLTK